MTISKYKRQSGFTIIELTTTLVIIGLLGAIGLAAASGLFGKKDAFTQARYQEECWTNVKATLSANPNFTGFTAKKLVDGSRCPSNMKNAAGNGLQSVWNGLVDVAPLGTGFEGFLAFTYSDASAADCSDFVTQVAASAQGVGVDAGGSGTYIWVKDRAGFGGTKIFEPQDAGMLTACMDSNNDGVAKIIAYYR